MLILTPIPESNPCDPSRPGWITIQVLRSGRVLSRATVYCHSMADLDQYVEVAQRVAVNLGGTVRIIESATEFDAANLTNQSIARCGRAPLDR